MIQGLSQVINRGMVFNILRSLFLTRAMYSKISGQSDYTRGFDDGFKAALAAMAQSIGVYEGR